MVSKKFRTLRIWRLVSALLLAGILWLPVNCPAAKLFAVTASYGDPAARSLLEVENGSFPDLVKDLINNYQQFEVLQPYSDYSAKIRFFALPDAFEFNINKNNANGFYEVRVVSKLTGLDKTFEAVDSDAMQQKIIDWLWVEGDDEALELLEEIFKKSTAVISDGSPEASTARMADSAFYLFGFYHGSSLQPAMRGAESGAHIELRVNSDSTTFESPVGTLQGDRITAAIPLWLHFNSRLSYVGQMDVSQLDLEGTRFYDLGLQAGLAVRPVVRESEDRFGWQVTPFIGAKSVISSDAITAAVLYHMGINNRFEWRLFERTYLSFTSQYADYNNIKIEIDDYELNTEIDQQIVKNGLMLEVPIFWKPLYGHLFAVDTRFIEDIGEDNYQTYGMGLSLRGKTFALSANTMFEKTDNLERVQFGLSLGWDL